ncbi:MAG: glycerate kinase type-2 family protein [Anaerolineaceae bacterium]
MQIQPGQFTTNILSTLPQKADVQRILASAIRAVEPAIAVQNYVLRQGNILTIEGQKYDLSSFENIYLIAIGKASQAMSESLANILEKNLSQAFVVPKQLFFNADKRFHIIAGGHPVPNDNSELAGQMLEKACKTFTERDLVFCLISGGGSALVTLPYEGIQLKDLQTLTGLLLASGARIDEINTLRRHLDRIKGGGLAKMAFPARVISLILSDVVNSPLEAIASGPTVADPTSIEDATFVLQKYDLISKAPDPILKHLGLGLETVKPKDPILEKIQNVLVADNYLASQASGKEAEKTGLKVHYLGNGWQGEARKVAVKLCNLLKANPDRHICMIAGGETTVTITGQGRGGRNQEMALAAVSELAGMQDVLFITLATDGEDGPTDAAGAVVSGDTWQMAHSAELNPNEFLNQNDAYNFFDRLGDLIKIGPTGTNVNDLTFLFRF